MCIPSQKRIIGLIILTDDLKNNLSTIVVIVTGALSPFVAQYLTHEQFSALVIAIIDVIFILYSAKYPNKLGCFGNATCDGNCNYEETVLNDEYKIDPVDGDEQ